MRRLFIHHVLFRLFAPVVFGVLNYLVILLVNNNAQQIVSLFSNEEVYVTILLSVVSLESMRAILVFVRFRSLSLQRKVVLQFLVTTIISVLLVLVSIAYYYKGVIGFDISMRELITFGVIYFLTALLYNALYIGNQYLNMENTLRLEQEHKMRENLEAEFAAFRQEINPDLLYESLEQLILTLHQEKDTAEELIDSMAALYRYQLIHRQREFVSLTEELQAVRHLLRLANQKHDNSIRWNPEWKETDQVLVIPGALIIAIDAILRNTLISARSPLVLSLQKEDEYLVLHHNLNDKLQLHAESIHSFQRLQRSYSVYSELPFVQVKTAQENYIKFPLIVMESLTEPA